jgi:hypothetical protein
LAITFFEYCQVPVLFVTITVTLRLVLQARRAMDEQVEHVEQVECVDQVTEELPDYALMVDVPD